MKEWVGIVWLPVRNKRQDLPLMS